MKNLKLLTLIILSVMVFSCSDNDGPGEPTIEDTIVGKWQASEFLVDGEATGNIGGINVSVDIEGDVYDNTYAVEFRDNPNTVTSTGDFSIRFTASFLGQSYEEVVEDVQFIGTGSWQIIGNQLIITTSTEERTFDIQTINATTLRVFGQIIETIDVEGTTAEAVIDLDLTFTRI